MKRFDEGDFVKQRTDDGHRVKMIVAVDRRADGLPQMDRFTLQDIAGHRVANIGAYELSRATETEVRSALDSP